LQFERAAPKAFGVGCGFESTQPNSSRIWLGFIFSAVLRVASTLDRPKIWRVGSTNIDAEAIIRPAD